MTAEFTTMTMITHPDTNQCVVIDRTKNWRGPSFPGGHVEPNESFTESAIREIKEETGLLVNSLTPCGVIHWINSVTDDRYVVFCYRTCDFTGTLNTECDEGRLFWTDFDKIESMPTQNDFKLYLPIFKDTVTEAVGRHTDTEGNSEFYYIK